LRSRSAAGRRTVGAAAAVVFCLVLAAMVAGAFGFFSSAYGIRQSKALAAEGRLLQDSAGAQTESQPRLAEVAVAVVLGVPPAPAGRRPLIPPRSASSKQALATVMSARYPYRASVMRAAARHAVDPTLVFAIMASESKGDPAALSPAGAVGLMQLMPETAMELGVDPWDPEENIEGAVRYLSGLLEQFQSVDLSLVAYNAGPGFAERYRQGEVDLGAETRAFLMRVAGLQ
jgi:soluble lytic murein transglycosylase-like protein